MIAGCQQSLEAKMLFACPSYSHEPQLHAVNAAAFLWRELELQFL